MQPRQRCHGHVGRENTDDAVDERQEAQRQMCAASPATHLCASLPPRTRWPSASREAAAPCEPTAAACSEDHVSFVSAAVQHAPAVVSRRTPGFRRRLRGRGKVTLFIEEFSEGRGSSSERATNGDPKVAGNISENTVSERIAGIRCIPGV